MDARSMAAVSIEDAPGENVPGDQPALQAFDPVGFVASFGEMPRRTGAGVLIRSSAIED